MSKDFRDEFAATFGQLLNDGPYYCLRKEAATSKD